MQKCIERNMLNREVQRLMVDVPVGIIHVFEHIVIGKYTDDDDNVNYLVSRDKIPESPNKSEARFISFEYTHPTMTETIPIELPSGMLIAGNVLFTSGFVLRVLRHQPRPFYFDMEYSIRVVDAMVNIFEVKNDECIVLTEHGYDVKKTAKLD